LLVDGDFSLLCSRLGADPWFTQGAGGNASEKLGNVLVVKASGRRLEHSTEAETWTRLNLSEARRIADAGLEDFSAALIGPIRASIETSLHAQSSTRFVLHLHFVPALAEAIRTDGEARLGRLLDGLNWSWVPYARPGAPLAVACRGRQAPIMILDRHGIVLNADETAGIVALLSALEARLAPRPAAAGLRADHVLARLRPVFPDQAVFLGARPFAAGLAPVVTGPEGLLQAAPGASPGAYDQMAALALLAPLVPAEAPVAPLPDGEAEALSVWDAEAYRQQVALAAKR
jgi:hypothetical protein